MVTVVVVVVVVTVVTVVVVLVIGVSPLNIDRTRENKFEVHVT